MLKIVYFGTPQFAANILSFLLQHHVDIKAVVTRPDRPKGRSGAPVSSPVKLVALEHGIVLHQPEKASTPEFADVLRQYDADLFIVAAYGEIVKQHLLDMPKIACLNVHPSLLPKYRGATPIQSSLIAGDKETAVTIMQMVLKMDAGDIIKTVNVPIDENINYGDLDQLLSMKGAELLLQVIHEAEKGSLPHTPQDHSKATFCQKIELEQCEVNWSWPAEKIHNLIRGVSPHPGAWCYVLVRGQKKRMKLITTRLVQESSSAKPGTILRCDKEGLWIACGEKSLRLLDLQLEGKKAMLAQEFFRGMPLDQFLFITEAAS